MQLCLEVPYSYVFIMAYICEKLVFSLVLYEWLYLCLSLGWFLT